MIKFRQKSFNEIIDGAWKGGAAGLTMGTTLAGAGLRINNVPGAAKFVSKSDGPWPVLAAGTIIGAALGALVGTAKEINKYISQAGTDNRLMKGILRGLKSQGYVEGKNFTRDPKTANLLKTKICIAFTRDAADFKILINMEGDPKLKSLSDKIIRKLPSSARARHQQASNKFNDIEIVTMSQAKSNIELITGLTTNFIEGGYPVYLVEVG